MTHLRIGWVSRAAARPQNQDCVLVDGMLSVGNVAQTVHLAATGRPVVVAVLDGMGGHRGGGVASRLAAALLGDDPMISTEDELTERLLQCHRSVANVGAALPGLGGMGTTIVGFHITDSDYRVFHIGDSTAYRLVDGFVGELTLPDRSADPRMPGAHLLTRCLGVGEEAGPSIDLYPIRRPVRLLACTDGVADALDPQSLAEGLGHGTPGQSAHALCTRAQEAGTRDNVTALVIDLTPSDD